MEQPTFFEPRTVAPDTDILTTYLPVPGFGVLPINAFLIRSAEPVLIDTGIPGLKHELLEGLRSRIDPKDIGWIWLTHADIDHVGALREVLDLAPNARLVTSFVGMAKLNLLGLPLDRVYLLNPGQSLDVGDRRLLAVKPPTYDAPEATGLFDDRSRAFFSVDSFGAFMESPMEDAVAIPNENLREGMITWATLDAPWLSMLDESKFGRTLATVRELDPAVVLSSHLPPAAGMTDRLVSVLASALQAPTFVGPDQAALEAMMRQPVESVPA